MRILPLAATALILAVPGLAQRLNYLTSAPVPGTTLRATIDNPASAAGNSYYWAVSAHTPAAVTLPSPYSGKLRVDPNTLLLLPSGTLQATPTTDLFPLPNDPTLLGVLLDMQSADIDKSTGAIYLADNDIVVTFVSGVGRAIYAVGSANAGTFAMRRVDSSNVGSSTTISAVYQPQRIYYTPPRGWGQGYQLGYSDMDVDPERGRRRRPAYNSAYRMFPTVRLPNGVEFAVVRDANKPKEFAVITIDSAGAVTEISGSRITSLYADANPTNPFADHWKFSDDGKLAFGVIDLPGPTSSTDTDRIVIVRTDNTNWPGQSSATINVVPPTLPLSNPRPQFGDGDVFVANEVVLFRGEQRHDGAGWPVASMWAFPLDGSLPGPVLIDYLFCSAAFEGDVRVSGDGKTLVYPRKECSTGLRSTNLVAWTGISKNGATKRDVTGWHGTQTSELRTVQTPFGRTRAEAGGFRAALSRDGSRVAFFAQRVGNAVPELYVAKTDGSQAGTLVPAAGFPSGTTYFDAPHFLEDPAANGDLLVFAGASAQQLDVYRVKADLSAVTNLTNKGDLVVPWTMVSDSGWLFFMRDFRLSTTSNAANLVGVSPNGILVDITGHEFGGGSAVDVVLDASPADNLFRRRPGNSTEMYFVAREVTDSPLAYSDDEVWVFDFEKGTKATRLTAFGYNPGLDRSITALEVRADGAFAFVSDVAGYGANGTTHVFFKPFGKTLANLSLGVYGELSALTTTPRYAIPSSLHLDGDRIAWVQGSSASSDFAVGCMVEVTANAGYALLLTGTPSSSAAQNGSIYQLTFVGR